MLQQLSEVSADSGSCCRPLGIVFRFAASTSFTQRWPEPVAAGAGDAMGVHQPVQLEGACLDFIPDADLNHFCFSLRP